MLSESGEEEDYAAVLELREICNHNRQHEICNRGLSGIGGSVDPSNIHGPFDVFFNYYFSMVLIFLKKCKQVIERNPTLLYVFVASTLFFLFVFVYDAKCSAQVNVSTLAKILKQRCF